MKKPIFELITLILSLKGVSSFQFLIRNTILLNPIGSSTSDKQPHNRRRLEVTILHANKNEIHEDAQHTWTPQDLTQDNPGYVPIPDDDYVKKYQANPELWPVEFFVIAYRRVPSAVRDINNMMSSSKNTETQILVRPSANGTSKWGLGTGVPITRWMLSSSKKPPIGYQWTDPRIQLKANHFPEFPNKDNVKPWTYQKIDICNNAFTSPNAAELGLEDPKLEEYAKRVTMELRRRLEQQLEKTDNLNSWESTRISVVKNAVDKPNCLAAVQGTFRMSGLFDPLGKNVPDPEQIVESIRIYTMWPQMPDPMPLPSTSPEELQNEILTRTVRMAETGRDPHRDKHGRRFTHISTSNVSNTIHGVYFTLDLTYLPGLDDVPALDLFGSKEIRRQWKSLIDLKVLNPDGETISTEDPKPTFISGFIVRQLVKEGVIKISK